MAYVFHIKKKTAFPLISFEIKTVKRHNINLINQLVIIWIKSYDHNITRKGSDETHQCQISNLQMYNMLCYLCTRLLMLPRDTFLGTLFPLGINLLLQDILQLRCNSSIALHQKYCRKLHLILLIPSLESSVLYFIISIPIWSITLQIITDMLILYCSEPIVCKIHGKPKNWRCTAWRRTTS